MPELVPGGLSIHAVQWRRCRFKNVRIGQIFFADGRWWHKRTLRTGIRADDRSDEFSHFRGERMVRVFDEAKPLMRLKGLSYEEFIRQSAL